MVVKPGVVLTEADVIAWCKEAVASYKKPKSVEFVAELPNNYGKVLKRELRHATGSVATGSCDGAWSGSVQSRQS